MKQKQIWFFLFLYAVVRIFSYFFSPQTPLYTANPVNTIVSTLILLSTVYFLWKKDERGWYTIALEMIIAGAGGFFAVGPLSLRTCLLGASLLIYFVQQISNFKFLISNAKRYLFPLLLIIWVGISALRGYLAGHNLSLIISDTIPYFFFLYYFPLKDALVSKSFNLSIFQSSIIAAIIGNFVLIIITFIGYSSGLLVLQDSYYHWYRDVALGKITELPFHFYRLVLNEHLLLVPVLLLLLDRLVQFPPGRGVAQGGVGRIEPTPPYPPAGRDLALAALLLIILSINLTRIYLLALAVGLLFLFNRQNWKRWLGISISALIFFCFSFTSIHLVASRGQSLGWEIFGIRLQSIVAPGVEESSLSRMLLLPKIVEKIRQNPLLGSGLGDTVTVYSPVFKTNITTPHFDWGYLEIWAELGLVGLAAWLWVMGYGLWGIRKINLPYKQFYVASLAALLVINLTSPALFHVLGIIWLTFLCTSNHNLCNPRANINSPLQQSV